MKIERVVINGPRDVALASRELDESLAPEQMWIDTEATFISAGTELSIYTGREPKAFQPKQWCTYPWPPGYANVGIVRAVGAAVTRAKVGDRVFTFGGHASALKCDQSGLVAPVPEGMDPVVAAASRMAGVALTALIVSEIRGDPWVVVFGLGAVGNLAAQGFLGRGCRVIGVDPSAPQRERARQCGIEHVISGDAESVARQVRELTGGQGAAITVDAVGHSAVICQAVSLTANHGQCIILGTPRVPMEGDLTPVFTDIHLRWITMRGALEWCLPTYPAPDNGVSQWSKQAMIFDWIQRGKLVMDPLISHRMAPGQIRDAYEGLENDRQSYAGVALVWK